MKIDRDNATAVPANNRLEQLSSDVVRWTDRSRTAQSRRKSAKFRNPLQTHHLSVESTMSASVTPPFQSCSRLSIEKVNEIHPDDDSCRSSMPSFHRSCSGSPSWVHFRGLTMYIVVALVIAGAISMVNCDGHIGGSVDSLSNSKTSDSRQLSSNLVISDPLDVEADSGSVYEDHYEGSGHYVHQWAVHIPDGCDETADQVALEHGFTNLGKINCTRALDAAFLN